MDMHWARGCSIYAACVEVADTSLRLRLKNPWKKTEQQWLFDGKKEGATLLVGKDFV